MVTSDAREITITKVEDCSPADSVFLVGDSILGVGGKLFSYDPRTEMGKALTLAESEAGKGNLRLTLSRAGNSKEVVVKLPVLGTYSATAPYDCPKSKRILEQGCRDLARQMADPFYAERQIPVEFAAFFQRKPDASAFRLMKSTARRRPVSATPQRRFLFKLYWR
jgi:hypothetical protein